MNDENMIETLQKIQRFAAAVQSNIEAGTAQEHASVIDGLLETIEQDAKAVREALKDAG